MTPKEVLDKHVKKYEFWKYGEPPHTVTDRIYAFVHDIMILYQDGSMDFFEAAAYIATFYKKIHSLYFGYVMDTRLVITDTSDENGWTKRAEISSPDHPGVKAAILTDKDDQNIVFQLVLLLI